MQFSPRIRHMARAGLVSAAALAASAGAAQAQDWPTRPLTLIVPFAAGGSSDAIARIVADGIGTYLH